MADRRTSPSPDLYKVLGVRPEANAAELSRAYRRRLRQLHPDMRQAGYGRAAGPDAEDRYGLDLAGVYRAADMVGDDPSPMPETLASGERHRDLLGATMTATASHS